MNSRFANDKLPVKLYRNPISGHCHRVQLMLALLDIPVQLIDLDMGNGAHKFPEFLALSPLGKVPAIDDNGVILSDSNAICVYLIKTYGDGYHWLPESALDAAELQRWLSIAAGEIAYGPCAVRLVKVFGVDLDYEAAKNISEQVFAMMELHLEKNQYLVNNTITLADVALYTYVAHAPEGGVSLEPYAAIRSWIERMEAQPRFVPMAKSPLPESI